MKIKIMLLGMGGLCMLSGCTDRRTASPPVADGDTIEVVIGKEKPAQQGNMPEIIDLTDSQP